VLALVGGAFTSAASGAMGSPGYFVGTGSGTIEGKPVSARVMFSVTGSDNKLRVSLTNTGTRDDYTLAHVLSDISFNLQGADFELKPCGSFAYVGKYSTLYYGNSNTATEPKGFDVSREWGLARNTTLPPPEGLPANLGPFDYSITAASFDGSAEKFASGDIDSTTGLNGADFGVMSFETSPFGPPLVNHEIIVNTVQVILCATRVLSISDLHFIKNPTFSYGSEHTGIAGSKGDIIPEPSTVVVWLLIGLTWAGAAWVCRHRSRWARRAKRAVLIEEAC
jgi:hypothetical protein